MALTKLKVVILMVGMVVGSMMGLDITSSVASASSIDQQIEGIGTKKENHGDTETRRRRENGKTRKWEGENKHFRFLIFDF